MKLFLLLALAVALHAQDTKPTPAKLQRAVLLAAATPGDIFRCGEVQGMLNVYTHSKQVSKANQAIEILKKAHCFEIDIAISEAENDAKRRR